VVPMVEIAPMQRQPVATSARFWPRKAPATPVTIMGRSGARMATDGPGGPGDNTGRSSAALSIGGREFLVAGGRVGGGGEV